MESDEASVPEVLTRKINLFFNITSNLYYQKQINRKGINKLGDKLRYDDDLKQLFTPSANHYLVKSTGNRMSFLKSFVEIIGNEDSKSIYFLIFTRSLNQVSQIFDKTTTSIEDIKNQLNSLKKICQKINQEKELFIIEINDFPEHSFILTMDNLSRIYEKK